MPFDNVQEQDDVLWGNTQWFGGSKGDFVKKMFLKYRPEVTLATLNSTFNISVPVATTTSPDQPEYAKTFEVPDTDLLAEAPPVKGTLFRGPVFQVQSRMFVAPRDVSFYPLQEWEGYVVDVVGDIFTARLVDKTANKTGEGEVGEFAVSDLTDDDRELLKPGAVFRWTIGYEHTKGGTKRRISDIAFRRLPQWTKFDIEKAKDRAKAIASGIQWE